MSRVTAFAVGLCGLFALAASARAADETAGLFATKVKPILESHCVKCHSSDEPKGGLRLTSREDILKGGDSGPAVDLNDPAASILISAVTYDGLEMPPTGKMPAEKIAAVTEWIKGGLNWPEGIALTVEQAHSGPPQINEQTKSHWSFRKLVRPEPPQVQHSEWVVNPIDAFVLKKLEDKGIAPSPPADRRTLIRRVTYDLIGLPPTPEDVEAFVNDESPDAYEKLIDRLLDSPHYGEQWARPWLDLVRYAETNSFERDGAKPFVWRYRDYVIQAFNNDKPFDQFALEQLAGDELDNVTADTMIATGFYRLGLWDDEPADPEGAFYEGLDDIAATTSQAFLGLTMNCARCHDHKLDPIPTKNYYQFIAFFRNVKHYGQRSDESVQAASLCSIASPDEQQKHADELAVFQAKLDELNHKMESIEAEIGPKLPGGEIDDFKSESNREGIIKKHRGDLVTEAVFDEYRHARRDRDRMRAHPPRSAEQALCVKENGPTAPETNILLRGSPQAKGDEVQPGFPEILSPPAPVISTPASGQSTGRRRALAEWIASKDNPLTARVEVNRIWQGHFDRGIVRSTNNFGLQGDAPTHPELLDWLASEFMARGWSLKAMHRLILTSNTYRQSSRHEAVSAGSPDPLALDPQNDLFWRFDMRRLRAEEVRDSILAANGSLNLDAMYGPSVFVKIAKEVMAGQSQPGKGWSTSSPDDERRRSIYIHVKRSLIVPILAAFDVADNDSTCPVRFASTQPTQALGLLNSEFANEEAGVFAKLAEKEAGSETANQVKFVLGRVYQRPATQGEIDRGLKLIADLEKSGQNAEAAMRNFCLLALNLNEFTYLD